MNYLVLSSKFNLETFVSLSNDLSVTSVESVYQFLSDSPLRILSTLDAAISGSGANGGTGGTIESLSELSKLSTTWKIAFGIASLFFGLLAVCDAFDLVRWSQHQLPGAQQPFDLEIVREKFQKSLGLLGLRFQQKPGEYSVIERIDADDIVKNPSAAAKSPSSASTGAKRRSVDEKSRAKTPTREKKSNKKPEAQDIRTVTDVETVIAENMSRKLIIGATATSPCETPYTACYEEMFSEPTRLIYGIAPKGKGTMATATPALCSRPGNSYSNFIYVFGGIYVFIATITDINDIRDHPFEVCDLLFGTVLFALGIYSTLWHASHSNVVHTLDLATMDFCIAYLLIRMLMLGVAGLQFTNTMFPVAFSKYQSGVLCLLICVALLTFLLVKRDETHGGSLLKSQCVFSGRRRLENSTIDMVGACLYLCMPAIYFSVPILLHYFVFADKLLVVSDSGVRDSATIMGTLACLSLVVAWSYRFSERFCMDGNVFMRYAWGVRIRTVVEKADRTEVLSWTERMQMFLREIFLVLLGCFLSPTAILHWLSGWTLLFGLGYCKNIEMTICE